MTGFKPRFSVIGSDLVTTTARLKCLYHFEIPRPNNVLGLDLPQVGISRDVGVLDCYRYKQGVPLRGAYPVIVTYKARREKEQILWRAKEKLRKKDIYVTEVLKLCKTLFRSRWANIARYGPNKAPGRARCLSNIALVSQWRLGSVSLGFINYYAMYFWWIWKLISYVLTADSPEKIDLFISMKHQQLPPL